MDAPKELLEAMESRIEVWREFLERRMHVDALCACSDIPCRMEAMNDIIRRFPGTDGRQLLWAAVAGVPTEKDKDALILALRN